MTSVVVITNPGSGIPPLAEHLESVGIDVVGSSTSSTMVPDVIRCSPDLVICYETHPDDALFAGTTALLSASPRPVVVFTSDTDAENINRAANAGIHVYVVNGYEPDRLRPVIHVAQARFRHDQLLRDELTDVRRKFGERKLVDRAKGILMRVRNFSEDDAHKALRTAAMQTKQRIGQVAQQVIDAARYAEAVNRSGQLRMLSQRLVKLYALMCAEVTPEITAGLCRESIEQIEANLSVLGRTLSKATFGDLIDAVALPWAALKAALVGPPALARLAEVDRLAERLLNQAEALTRTLQAAGFASALHVINVSGRQRMLSQRLAKQAIVAGLLSTMSAVERTLFTASETAFAESLAYLQSIPLTSKEIGRLLDAAATVWSVFQPALAEAKSPQARKDIASMSETLLVQFGQLTDLYERGMQMLTE